MSVVDGIARIIANLSANKAAYHRRTDNLRPRKPKSDGPVYIGKFAGYHSCGLTVCSEEDGKPCKRCGELIDIRDVNK